MVSFTDWCFGQLMAGVDSSAVKDRTAVFFTSDHGDFGGDYGLVEKWPGAGDDILTRVPLLARVPGGAPGRRFKGPVQTADVWETMIDMAGISNDPNMQWLRFGVSLVGRLTGSNKQASEDDDLSRFVFSEGGFGYYSEVFPGGSDHVTSPTNLYWPRALEEMSNNGSGSPKWVMVRNATVKLVYRPMGISELYEYLSDPTELNNLYYLPSSVGLRMEMTEVLLKWLTQTADVPVMRQDPRGSPSAPNPITSASCEELLQPDPARDVVGHLLRPDHPARRGSTSVDYFEINGIFCDEGLGLA